MRRKFSKKAFLLRTLSNALILGGFFLLVITIWPLIDSEIWYRYKEFRGEEYKLSTDGPVSLFSRLLGPTPTKVTPVNDDFSIIIEKIGLNAPVIEKVSVINKDEYLEALKYGVAHAKGTALPSDIRGNVYLFSHSDVSFWERGEYSDAFNLLRKLTLGDRIHIIYKGKNYVYEVINRELLKGFNTYPLTRRVIEPILTLQTCDPPGTSIRRLVITARRI